MASNNVSKRSLKGTTATQRLKQDYLRIIKDPVPYVRAHPVHNNILEWFGLKLNYLKIFLCLIMR
jgi:ubiquitin-conjugating enzyme E2 J2